MTGENRLPQGRTDELRVELGGRGYPIIVQCDAWDSVVNRVRQSLPDLTHTLVVCDEAVRQRWGNPLVEGFGETGRCDLFTVPSGEPSKSLESLGRLWDWMLASGADRRSVVIAVGGGVVGDLAGFAAATYARGIRLVQLPTTLLSMVDSSVGGKTGINLAGGKNLVGAFWQPSLVVIDTATLRTLDDRGYRGGLAEVIKYGLIEDADFFDWLEANADHLLARRDDVVARAIMTCCRIKAAVVADDERETSGRRAILNYGHTFGHAIEATAGYGVFTHGEAVAIGMAMAARLARSLGRIGDEFVARQDVLLTACGLPTRWPEADPQAMVPVMKKDKKVAHALLRFVLPTRIGHVELVACDSLPEIEAAILACR
ncbi:MAG: 3-dehydroquinate synthase [Planctomycetaceae bacterium]|nr:MAG: 3-dehydroquinate synthase [Planctomycetaceae bacterium]